ncbi:hypothetical protein MUNTM_50980 [Mycobacterium sp. MUNTM1]
MNLASASARTKWSAPINLDMFSAASLAEGAIAYITEGTADEPAKKLSTLNCGPATQEFPIN